MSKYESLQQSLGDIRKAFGNGSIVTANEIPPCFKIPLKNPAFNYISTGGIPLNKVTEFVGRFSSTKTLHTYLAMAAFQRIDWSGDEPSLDAISDITFKSDKHGIMIPDKIKPSSRRNKNPEFRYCAFVDLEGTFDRDFAKQHGVILDGVIYSAPQSLEEAVELLLMYLSNENISLVVFDSMSAMADPDEAEKSMDEHTMATNAKFWNKATRKIRKHMSENPNGIISLILINSLYSKVGMVMGDPDVTRNGEQVNLLKSLSVKFTPLKEIKAASGPYKDEVSGRNIKLTNLKNKFGEPKRHTTFFFSFLDDHPKKPGHPYIEGQIVDMAAKMGLINRKGSWYEYGSTREQGQDKFLLALLESPDFENLTKEVQSSF